MKIKNLALLALFFSFSASAHDSHEALQASFMDALRASDAAALASHYTEDAVSYDVTNQKIVGPAGIAASWGGFFAKFNVLDAQLIDPHLEVHGDTGVAWGEFTMTVEPVGGGEAFEMRGRYSDVTRKTDAGWRYVMDHVSMPLPGE